MAKKKIALECTINFQLSITSDEVEVEVLDVENENKFIEIDLKNRLGVSKISIVTSTDALKKIIQAVE